MRTTRTHREAALARPAQASPHTPQGWRHPFDSAGGTIGLGVLLTFVLLAALRLLGG